jgi:hypothetical protein
MLKEILSISGQPGLYKMISKGNNSVIVESLLTGKRMPAHSTNKVISLEDIAIFTTEGEVGLKEVLKKIAEKESNQQAIDHKSEPALLKAYLKEVLPNYDENRVYVSDIKKLVQWYNILQENNLLVFEEELDENLEVEEKSE